MKMRKKLALGMVFMLVLSAFLLAGCSSTPQDTSAPQEDGEEVRETVEVDIFQFKVEIGRELEQAARAYEADNPGVKINIETVGGGDDYGAALRAKFQSGAEPAIFNVGGPQDVEDWMSKLEDLSDQPWVDLALDGILSGATVDGKVYALPFNIEGYGFIYNKGIFEAAGIDAASIVDYASLEEAVKTLDSKIKAGELKDEYPLLEAVFEYAARETWVTGLHTSNAFLGQEFDSSIDAFNANTVEFNYADAFKKLIDLQADYSSNTNSKRNLNAVDYTAQVEEGIAIERVAITQQGNWVYGGVKGVDPAVADNLDILPMPVIGGQEDVIPVGVPMHWTVNKDVSEEVKEVAKDFLNWLYTSDTGKDYIVNQFYFIPPLSGYENFKPEDSLGAAVQRYAEAGKTTPWVFMGYPTGWGMDVLGINIQRYLDGSMTWEELISDSQAQWERMR
ncbi:MAG: carbohydrate ABC transporter substrate-binding protein [Clostridiaceae bacterium]|nr:carbohydrate ABC transporter substrate-binding protein [Clostridiaceae bacterium]